MLDFYFIGTSGKVPQPHRRLTSAMVRADGDIILIDAGEGTQMGISSSGWTAKAISTILITHLHADHVLGLAGVLLQIHNSCRTERVIIAGPKGIRRYVNSLYLVLPTLKFPIYFIELTGESDFILTNALEIDAFRLNHSISCYGYSFYLRHVGKFDVEKAKSVPKRAWGELSKGFATRDFEGNKVRNDQVLGPERKGIKITYVTDTRPTESIVEYASHSDLFVCEGMYVGSGENERKDEINKVKNYHMTFNEAATLAKHANVKRLMLTHFNPSLQHPSTQLDVAREIFKETYAASDDLLVHFNFDNEAVFDRSLINAKGVKGSITKLNPYADYLCFEDRNTRKQKKKPKQETKKRYGKRRVGSKAAALAKNTNQRTGSGSRSPNGNTARTAPNGTKTFTKNREMARR